MLWHKLNGDPFNVVSYEFLSSYVRNCYFNKLLFYSRDINFNERYFLSVLRSSIIALLRDLIADCVRRIRHFSLKKKTHGPERHCWICRDHRDQMERRLEFAKIKRGCYAPTNPLIGGRRKDARQIGLIQSKGRRPINTGDRARARELRIFDGDFPRPAFSALMYVAFRNL